MRSRAWIIAGVSIICAAAQSISACGGDTTGPGGGGNGTGAGGASSSTTTTTTTSTTSTGGGGGIGGTGGTGGSMATPDTCPGEAFSIGVEKKAITGSTVGLKNDYDVTSASCAGGATTSGPDAVYALTFKQSSTVQITLSGKSPLDAILIIESQCGVADSLLFCQNQTTSGSEQQTLPVAANETIYVIVGGNAGSAGAFELDIDSAAGKCGDGYKNTGEECDDGNTADGDGCDSNCKLEPPKDTSDTCPGDIVPITQGTDVDIQGLMPAPIGNATTTNYVDDYTTCDGDPMPGGKDRVFQFVPATAGTMHLELRNIGSNGGFDGMLSAWRDSCTPTAATDMITAAGDDPPSGATYLGCSDHALGMDAYVQGMTSTYEYLQDFTVTAHEQIFVVVDGFSVDSEGQFWLHAELH
jgi:cysteine-rich repeat protein